MNDFVNIEIKLSNELKKTILNITDKFIREIHDLNKTMNRISEELACINENTRGNRDD